ncbi:MAG: pyrroline-5-carboxylate reductase [Pseudomonadales bacterium]|jgi:pyrroline-5-carboxylate reductase|nr:pyrroline-5-carboxylate reductase [Pseudomonadales bacterium]
MTRSNIAFIGGGNMSGSMVGGIIARGWDPRAIRVSDPDAGCRERLGALGVHTSADNHETAASADIVVLAVKPQQLRSACRDIAAAVAGRGSLVISIAAGIGTASLQSWLGPEAAIVRCMPNTPALLQASATALYATPTVSAEQRAAAHEILSSIGFVAWVEDEEAMHAVTAVSGSGPAYFFLVMEAMQLAGENLGLDPALARQLTAQTALGAARMALETDVDVVELRRRVTSPGGTTERALRVLEERGLRRVFESALEAASNRSRELADELGQP